MTSGPTPDPTTPEEEWSEISVRLANKGIVGPTTPEPVEKPWFCPVCNYAVPKGHGGDQYPLHNLAAKRYTEALATIERLEGEVERLREVEEITKEIIEAFQRASVGREGMKVRETSVPPRRIIQWRIK